MFIVNHIDGAGNERLIEADQVFKDGPEVPLENRAVHIMVECDEGLFEKETIRASRQTPEGPDKDGVTHYRDRVYVMNDQGKTIATYIL